MGIRHLLLLITCETNSKANSDILNIKEILWGKKTHGMNNFSCVMGLSNYKEIEKYSFEAKAYMFSNSL